MANKRKHASSTNGEQSPPTSHPKDGFYIPNFFNAGDFVFKYNHEIKKKLKNKDEHRRLLENWPFKHFLHMPPITISRHFLLDLFKTKYDIATGGFSFKGQLFHTSADDFSLVLGVTATGDPVKPQPVKMQQKDLVSVIAHKFNLTDLSMKREELEKVMFAQLEPEGTATAEEWVSIFTMYFFSMVLFPRINRRVPMHLFEYVDDLEKLWDYNWGAAVHTDMSAMFKDLATTVKEHYISGKGRSPGLRGCVLALQAWVMERTRPTVGNLNTTKSPRYRNWEMEWSRQEDIDKVYDSIPTNSWFTADIVPKHNEAWIFFQDAKLRKYAYLNPSSLETPFNVITTFITNKIHESLLRGGIEHINHVVQIAKLFPAIQQGQGDNAVFGDLNCIEYPHNMNEGMLSQNGVSVNDEQITGTTLDNTVQEGCLQQENQPTTPRFACLTSNQGAAAGTSSHPISVRTSNPSTVRYQLGRNPLNNYVQLQGALYKWDSFPQVVRQDFYNRYCYYRHRTPKPCRTTLAVVKFTAPGRSPLADTSNGNGGPVFDKTPLNYQDSSASTTFLLSDFMDTEEVFAERFATDVLLPEPHGDSTGQQAERAQLRTAFEKAFNVIPGEDFPYDFCIGWDAGINQTNYNIIEPSDANMLQVLRAFNNGFLLPSNASRLIIDTYINVGMVELHNALTGEVISREVMDAIAYLIFVQQRKVKPNWICVPCGSVEHIPMAAESDLNGKKFHWIRDHTLAEIQLLFLPFSHHGQWFLITFNICNHTVVIYTSIQQTEQFTARVSDVIYSWIDWLGGILPEPSQVGSQQWSIKWDTGRDNQVSNDSGLYAMTMMESLINGATPSITTTLLHNARPKLVYNIIALHFYRRTLPDIHEWRSP